MSSFFGPFPESWFAGGMREAFIRLKAYIDQWWFILFVAIFWLFIAILIAYLLFFLWYIPRTNKVIDDVNDALEFINITIIEIELELLNASTIIQNIQNQVIENTQNIELVFEVCCGGEVNSSIIQIIENQISNITSDVDTIFDT